MKAVAQGPEVENQWLSDLFQKAFTIQQIWMY